MLAQHCPLGEGRDTAPCAEKMKQTQKIKCVGLGLWKERDTETGVKFKHLLTLFKDNHYK